MTGPARTVQRTLFPAVSLCSLAFAAQLASAQQLPPATGTPGVPGEMRTVSGRVLSGSSDTLRPIAGQMVVLHRISADSSGPLDSTLSTAAGAYRFRYRLEGPRTMYIVSARYAGVAYFTVPLAKATVSSPEGDVTVYDTSAALFPLTVRARHLVVSPADRGVRRVVDVFEVANDSNRTLIGGADGVTWRVALPRDAKDFASTGGELPPDAFRFSQTEAQLLVPVPPGSRQLVLTYSIPASGSVDVPVVDATSTLEVLIEGAEGSASGAGLTAEGPVSMEGRTFRRYTASDVSATTFEIGGAAGGASQRTALLAVVAVAVALGILFGRRLSSAAPAPVVITVERTPADVLAREIVALDNVSATSEGAAGEYYRFRRAALLEKLVSTQSENG